MKHNAWYVINKRRRGKREETHFLSYHTHRKRREREEKASANEISRWGNTVGLEVSVRVHVWIDKESVRIWLEHVGRVCAWEAEFEREGGKK